MTDDIDEQRYRQQISTLRMQVEDALNTAERRYAQPEGLISRLLGLGPRDNAPAKLREAARLLREVLYVIRDNDQST